MIISKINKNEKVFFMSYGMYIAFNLLYVSFYARYISPIMTYVMAFCILLLFLSELTQKYSFSTLIFLFLFIILSIGIYALTKTSTVGFAITFVYCSRNIEFRKIARFTAIICSFLLAFIILSSFLGLIENHVQYRDGTLRMYCGFRYALYAPAILFNVTAIYIYLDNKAIKISKLLMLLFINCIMFALTNSRLSFYLAIVLIGFSLVLKINPTFFQNKKVICRLMVCSFFICSIVSIALTITYNGAIPWEKWLNATLGNRLRLGQRSFFENGVTWFGQEVSFIGAGLSIDGKLSSQNYNYVDNMYVQIPQLYGIVFLIIYLFLNTAVLYQSYKEHNYHMMIILFVFAIRGMIDDLQICLYYNTFWFVVGEELLSTQRYAKHKYANQRKRKVNHSYNSCIPDKNGG